MKHISQLVGMLINKIVVVWGSEDPLVIKEKPLHSEKDTLARKCDRNFLENDDGTTVTVNSKRYGHLITDHYFCLVKNTIWRICGENVEKTLPHATQLV